MVSASVQVPADVGAVKAKGLIDKDRVIHSIESFAGGRRFSNSASPGVGCSVIAMDKD